MKYKEPLVRSASNFIQATHQDTQMRVEQSSFSLCSCSFDLYTFFWSQLLSNLEYKSPHCLVSVLTCRSLLVSDESDPSQASRKGFGSLFSVRFDLDADLWIIVASIEACYRRVEREFLVRILGHHQSAHLQILWSSCCIWKQIPSLPTRTRSYTCRTEEELFTKVPCKRLLHLGMYFRANMLH